MTDLRRHVPPLTLTWDEETPGAQWRVVDGTLVFADVSGFTALTERLAQRGRIAAEEIVETLNRAFGPMLRIAAARGGELLKFGGDALLFLFRGPNHIEQACDAAVEMRVALRVASALRTSVGRLQLSMSVGIHSGDLHLFLVGAPTRELLILGPGATAVVAAEAAAAAREVVVSPATAARLGLGALRRRDDGQLLLRRRAPRSPAPGPAGLPIAGPDLMDTLFPRALGRFLGPSIPDPEHRLACIAFIRFGGTDAVLANDGPEVLAESLHQVVTHVEAALAAEEVSLLATDLDRDGGKFFLGSGIPAAFEDNEGRMLRALRRVADADSPLPLQLGTSRGHVFAAEVGTMERGAYTGMGDTTNTAARIMAKAPAGSVYAHPAVLEHSRTRFVATPAGPFPMKGKALPLLVYEVGEELGAREDAGGQGRLPLLGRDAELDRLCQLVEAALAGDGTVVTIEGASGMGKTRLAKEALARLSVDHLLVVRAEPYSAASAYRVFRDPMRLLLDVVRDQPQVMGEAMLASLARIAPELLPMAPLLADVLAVDVPSTPEVDQLDPQFRPERLADAVIGLLERARPGRLLIVAEDAHWADGASERLLERIALATAGRPWALMAVRRPDAGGFAPTSGDRVELSALPPDVVERLVIAATDATPLRPHEVAAMVDRAEGNPLFVEEVTRLAVGIGSLEALPESVGAATSAQIDALRPHVRTILRYCSVLGRSFRLETLQDVLGAEGQVLELGDLAALGTFLEPGETGRLRFRNGLVRDVAYQGLAYRLRSRMHRTAGETMERTSADLDADAPMLALHYWRAGDPERTWHYALRAGTEARRAYANADAAELYERAIEVSRRVPGVTDADRARIWATLGEVRELAGVLDGAIEAYRRAATLTADPVARAELLAKRARVHDRAGASTTALRIATRARRLLALVTGPEAAWAGVRLDYLMAAVRMRQEHSQEARAWAERTVAGARRTGDSETLARALMIVDMADLELGAAGVGANTREALDIFVARRDAPNQSVAQANLGVVAFLSGRWGEAVDWFTASRQSALVAGNDFGAAETDLNMADILMLQGRLDEAEESIRSAARVVRASGVQYYVAYADMLRARLSLAQGDVEAADELAAVVAARFLELGSPASALEASLVRAEAALAGGRPSDALAMLTQAQADARGEGAALQARAHLLRADAYQGLGMLEQAAAAAEAGLEAARAQGLPYEEALLLIVRSEIDLLAGGGTTKELAADAARAQQILDGLGARGARAVRAVS